MLAVLALGGAALLFVRRRKIATGLEKEGPRKKKRQVRISPDDVARLVGAVRSILTVRGEIVQALEMALASLREPLRSTLRAELDAWYAGQRRVLFSGLNGTDPEGYFQQFAAIVSAPEATRESILEALRQLEERIAAKKK